ncbi:alcohol dehydrogenase catalytic domain-containing protein [Alicyclobacillus acidiphilus]|uniref:alcohol dehydrogenase catalytic domain-containing protein n=1 Tax=Alicyclobacillus acidiphilus TaxID=182455 RepID=UPI000833E469|nr:alcohol dehydrogenase catalytic domain-containing protein [Alicyclobacillus acidiphilus]
MRAVQFSPEYGLQYVDMPRPDLRPDEVLLRVDACGVCGSDRQVIKGESAPQGTAFPVILGHEVAGTVVDCGDHGAEWPVGTTVIVHPFTACGTCAACARGQDNLCIRQGCIGYTRPGGFAEFVAVPVAQLVRRPETLDPAGAALLVDAYATPYRALMEAEMEPGRTVLVIGTGGLGLAALQLLQAWPAASVGAVSRRAEGVAIAESFGAHLAVTTEDDPRSVARSLRRWSGAGGIDIVIDTVSDRLSVAFAVDVVRNGGTIVCVGMSADSVEVPMAKLVRRGIRVIGSYASRKADVESMVRWVAEGRFDPAKLIGEQLDLRSVAAAFSPARSAGRVVVLPNQADVGAQGG